MEKQEIEEIKKGFSNFADERLKGETPLRQTQLILLRLLKIFDETCKKNNLRYWICGGTLLGAVRHKGFIPWDDDADVEMPFEDYVKFCSIAKETLPKDVFFQTAETDKDWIAPWVKIRDRFSFLKEAGGPYPYSQSISLDIFPICTLTENQIKHRNLYAYLPPYNQKPERIVRHLSFLSKCRILVQGTFQRGFILVSKIPFIRKSLINYFEKGRNTDSEKMQDIYPIRFDQIFPKDIFYPLKKLKFEDAEFFVPNNYDKYLTILYGDYMQLPPEEKRVSEHAVTEIYPTGPNPHFSALKWDDFYDEKGNLK